MADVQLAVSDSPTDGDDAYDELTAPLPEATQSPLFMALGSYLQRPFFAGVTGSAALGALVVGGLQLAGEGFLPWRVPAITNIVSASLNVVLLLVVMNGPYELLKRVRGIAMQLQMLGLSLRENVGRLELANAAYEDANATHVAANVAQMDAIQQQEEQNTTLRGTVEMLSIQLDTANALRQGMNDMLKRMLNSMGTQHNALKTTLATMAEEVDRLGEVSDGVRTQLYATLTGLDAAQQEANSLSERLLQAVSANADYAREMIQLITRMEDVVETLNDESFSRDIEHLVSQLDALGDNGLRDKLTKPSLGPISIAANDARVLGDLLVGIDTTLRKEKEERCPTRRTLLGDVRAQVASCQTTMTRHSTVNPQLSTTRHATPNESQV